MTKFLWYENMETLNKNIITTLSIVAIAAIVVLFASGPLVGNHALAHGYGHHHHHSHHHHYHGHHHN